MVLTPKQIEERKKALKDLEQSLLTLTLLQDNGISTEELDYGMVIRVADELVDTHHYYLRLMPEPSNLYM